MLNDSFSFPTDQASNCQDAKESTVNELEFEIWMASPIFFSYEACLEENKKSLGKYILDVLWCQPIKLIHVVSTSEFHEY